MIEVTTYRSGESLPSEGDYLVINKISRIRVSEYYISAGPSAPDLRLPPGPVGFASQETAIGEARKAAEARGFSTIYVELASL